MTLREAVNRATQQLAGFPYLRENARRDAVLLLLHLLGISPSKFHAEPERNLTSTEQTDYNRLVERRLSNEPIQYITGEQEFYGLPLYVSPAVLIPRPETEHLVESVLARFDHAASPHIVDVGTGSGAIAIAIAHHLPNASITAVDISAAALEVATKNAARHQLSGRIRFLESNLLAVLHPCHAAFDAIVSNPPYVSIGDRDNLHPQVRDFEPETALFTRDGGLSIYRQLIPQAFSALKPNGLLALEIGHGQRDALKDLLAGWNEVYFVEDLQRIPRVSLARRP